MLEALAASIALALAGCAGMHPAAPPPASAIAPADSPQLPATSCLGAASEKHPLVLLFGGQTSHAELFDPADGEVTSAGQLGMYGRGITFALLPSGCVLAAGGHDGVLFTTAEIYNPTIPSIREVPGMLPRYDQYSVRLHDGRILMFGGFGDHKWSKTSVLYDPVRRRFSLSGSVIKWRYGARATVLANGNVLWAGGIDRYGNLLSSMEIYDPSSGSFSEGPAMPQARADHTATLLRDGKVLFAGGRVGPPGTMTASAVLYDPASGKFEPTGSMVTARAGHQAVLLSDGRVLIFGGQMETARHYLTGGSAPSNTVELYDPVSGRFEAGGTVKQGKYMDVVNAVALPGDRAVFVVGDVGARVHELIELYDPSHKSFTVVAKSLYSHAGGALFVLK